MAKGANKQFIEQRERFLQKNVTLSPNIQSYMAAKAMSAKVPPDRVAMVGVYDFDLRKDPNLDIRDHSGKKQDVYKLYLLEQRAVHNVGVVTKDTNAIRAFSLPWDKGEVGPSASTTALISCSHRRWMVAPSSPSPESTRAFPISFQNAAKTRIDPQAIDADIAVIYGVGAKASLRKFEKTNYSDDAQKEEASTRPLP